MPGPVPDLPAGPRAWPPAGLALAMLAGVPLGTAAHFTLAVLPSPGRAVLGGLAGALVLVMLLAQARWGAAPRSARARWVRAAVAVVACALAVGAFAAWRAAAALSERLDPPVAGRPLWLTLRVSDLPRPGPEGSRFEAEVLAAEVLAAEVATPGPAPLRVPPRVALSWAHGPPGQALGEGADAVPLLRPGQVWRLVAVLRAPAGLANAVGPDTERWFLDQGLGASGSVRARLARPVLLAQDDGAWWARQRQRQRERLWAALGDRPATALLVALAVGDQAGLWPRERERWQDTATSHLIAISGLHLTMLAWLGGALAAALWRRCPGAPLRRPAGDVGRWCGVAVAAAYMGLAGGGVPAQRTVLMLAVAAGLRQAGLAWPWGVQWAVALAAVLLWDPGAWLQPGAWLSFVAVAMLMASGEGDGERERDVARDRAASGSAPPGRPSGARRDALASAWRRGREALRGAGRSQWIATWGLLPLTLWCFGQVSLAGLPANLVAVPLVTGLITPLTLAGMAWPALWTPAAALADALSALLAVMADWPGARWAPPQAPAWAVAAALGGAALALADVPARLRLAGALWVLPLLAPAVPRPPPGHWAVDVLDVGQGSAVLVRTRHHTLLFDAGPAWGPESDAGQRVLVPVLQALGAAPLDRLVLSHGDTDHVGGAATVLRRVGAHALASGLPPGHPLRTAGPPHRPCRAGEGWTWDGVRFEWLHPTEPVGPRTRPNAGSCVLRVDGGPGRRLLLTGDIEAPQEAALTGRHCGPAASTSPRPRPCPALQADLLVLAHHGSRGASGADFLAAVAPRLALIQAGQGNRYGHPHAETLGRLADAGIPWRASPGCGAWSWRSDRPLMQATCRRLEARRYWHAPVPALVQAGLELAKPWSSEGIPP